MRKRKYTMSDKRIRRDLLKANLDYRIEVVSLRNQGWTYQSIANKFGVSKQAVEQVIKRTQNKTVEELEKMRVLDNITS